VRYLAKALKQLPQALTKLKLPDYRRKKIRILEEGFWYIYTRFMPKKAGRRQTRRRAEEKSVAKHILLDVLAIVLILLFISSVLILFVPEVTGTAGAVARKWLIYAIGYAGYGVPLCILAGSLALLPLNIRLKAGLWTLKLFILVFVFSLLLGSFGGAMSESGGYLGSYFRDLLKEPYLGIFYPMLLSALAIALIIAFTGRAVIVPAMQVVERLVGEFRETTKMREVESEEAEEEPEEPEEPAGETYEPATGQSREAQEDSLSTGSPKKAPEKTKVDNSSQPEAEDAPAHTQIKDQVESSRQLRLEPKASDYKLPPIELLDEVAFSPVSAEALKRNAQIIEKTLNSFNISAQVVSWEVGPRVTRFELKIGPGININRLHALSDNLALELAVHSVRLETPIPGKSAVGIEVPNPKFNKITLRGLLTEPEMQKATHPLAFPVGRDLAGNPVIGNIHHMHHLLIAGSTGSGKSVCINSMIVSLLYRNSPATVKFILIDPKRVELSAFKTIPHLATPIVHDINEAQSALRWAVSEMENRLSIFESFGVKNIDSYNEKFGDEKTLPYILVVIDELADLIKAAGPIFERLIARIAHLARATGIHLVVATQRPDTTVITGNIKMNIPSRISFAVVSQIDSRTILDMPGAEKLLGSGDMLYFPVGIPKPIRVQGAWVRDEEVARVVDFVSRQAEQRFFTEIAGFASDEEEEPAETEELDPLYSQAYEIIVSSGRASTSLLQRRLKIGYNRAARIMEQMERMGVVSPADREGNRELLVPDIREQGNEEF